MEELYNEIPKLREIEQNLFSMMKILCIKACSGNIEAVNEIKIKHHELLNQRQILLNNADLSDEILLPKYTCKLCEDTGFYKNNRCECFKKLCDELALSKLPKKLGSTYADFENFSLNYYKYDNEVYKYMESILKAMINYAENSIQYGKNLLILGKTGTGKTHLALSIAKRALNCNSISSVIFTSAFFICEAIECERYESRNPTQEQITLSKNIFKIPLLIIDNLDTIRYRNDDREVLYNLLETRLISNLPTIITTSMNGNEIKEKCGNNIFIKLQSAYTLCQLKGNDIRIQKLNA